MTTTAPRNGRSGPSRRRVGGTGSSTFERTQRRTGTRTERTGRIGSTEKTRKAAAQQKSAADRAYDRRRRRAERMADPRLTMVGVPIRETMARIPFVIVVIALLAVGGVGVLYLNTRTDEVGMRTTDSQERAVDLRLQVESLQRDIAGLDSISEIARKAREMGLVQAVDPAVIVVTKGRATVIGTPSPAPSPTSAPPAAAPNTASNGAPAGTTAPATTAAKSTAASATAATAATATAARTTAARTTAGSTTVAKNKSTKPATTTKAGR